MVSYMQDYFLARSEETSWSLDVTLTLVVRQVVPHATPSHKTTTCFYNSVFIQNKTNKI